MFEHFILCTLQSNCVPRVNFMNLETVRTRTPWNSVSQLVIRQIVLPVAFKSLFESKSRFSFLQFFFGSQCSICGKYFGLVEYFLWQIFWSSRVLFVANILD